ncbi:MAG: carbohydrate ABC transporter permease [Thermomicrobiales bacterium]
MTATIADQASSQPISERKPFLGQRRLRYLHRFFVYAMLLILSVAFVLPFLWMVSTSLKEQNEVFTYPPSFFPSSFHWRNYVDGWRVLPFTTFLRNSLIVTCANVVGNLISCTLVAYGFARLRARSKNVLFLLMLATIMIPREVTIVPRFIFFSHLHLVNTFWPLILPAWFGYPFFIFLLRQFFMTIPRDLDDAARMDGASHFRILIDIIVPLSKPALATVAVFAFIGNWTNVLDPLIYIRSTNLYTLPLGLNLFRGPSFTQFNWLMAVSIITVIPVMVVFFFAQRAFVRGVTLSGMGGR